MESDLMQYNDECIFAFNSEELLEAISNAKKNRRILLEKSIFCSSLINASEEYILDKDGKIHKDIIELEKIEDHELEKYAKLNNIVISMLREYKEELLTSDAIDAILKNVHAEVDDLPISLKEFLEELIKLLYTKIDKTMSTLKKDLGKYEFIYVLSIRGNYFCSKDFEDKKISDVIEIIEKKRWLKNAINIAGIITLLRVSLKYQDILRIFPTSRSIGKVAKQFKLPFVSVNTQVGQGSKNHARIVFDCLVQVIKASVVEKISSGDILKEILRLLSKLAMAFPASDIVIGFGVQFVECALSSEGTIVFEKIKRYLQKRGVI